MLNSLLHRYSEEFLLALELPKKYDSLAIFLCSSFKKELDLKFKNFNYKIDYSKYETFDLNDRKFGQDILKQSKPKTIRRFLND